MKLDFDLLHSILAEFEADEDWLIIGPDDADMEKLNQRRVYHFLLLEDAGFIINLSRPEKVVSLTSNPYRLTMRGHEYLTAIRDEGIWARVKNEIAVTGGSASIEIVRQLAVGFVKKQLERHTGIEF